MCTVSWIIGPLANTLRFGLTTYITEDDGVCFYGAKWPSNFWRR